MKKYLIIAGMGVGFGLALGLGFSGYSTWAAIAAFSTAIYCGVIVWRDC